MQLSSLSFAKIYFEPKLRYISQDTKTNLCYEKWDRHSIKVFTKVNANLCWVCTNLYIPSWTLLLFTWLSQNAIDIIGMLYIFYKRHWVRKFSTELIILSWIIKCQIQIIFGSIITLLLEFLIEYIIHIVNGHFIQPGEFSLILHDDVLITFNQWLRIYCLIIMWEV